MRRTVLTILGVWFVAVLMAVATAESVSLVLEDKDMNIEQRFSNQERRIDKGIAAGQITRAEADVLLGNLKWIKDRYNKLRSDGLLTPAETQKLQNMLNDNSQMIQKSKNDTVRRLY